MYAFFTTGGKQYRVQEGDEIDVELLNAEASVLFTEVLLVSDGSQTHVGTPYLENYRIHAEVIGQEKGPKTIAFKYKRGNYRRTVGHRQKYSRVKITKIAAA